MIEMFRMALSSARPRRPSRRRSRRRLVVGVVVVRPRPRPRRRSVVLVRRRPGAEVAVAALVADREAAEHVLEGLRVAVKLEEDPPLVDDELEDLGAQVDVAARSRARRRARARRSGSSSTFFTPVDACRGRSSTSPFFGGAPRPRYGLRRRRLLDRRRRTGRARSWRGSRRAARRRRCGRARR